MRAKYCAGIIAVLSAFLVLTSCSSGPKRPAVGSPAFYWSAAKETFAAGDYMKTVEHLDRLLAQDNEYAARALPWSLVLTSGITAGYLDVADSYEAGAKMNRVEPGAFRRQVSVNRRLAASYALPFAERFAEFQKQNTETVPLAFGYPIGNPNQATTLTRVAAGMMPPEAEIELASKHAMERGVLLAACDAAGAPNDTAKAQQILSAADPKGTRAAFQFAMAKSLYKLASVYSRDKLDEPNKLEILAQRAKEALKTAPPSKEAKELATKIDALVKKTKKT